MHPHDKAMTIKEVAGVLSISTQMVYNLVHKGRLPAFKIGSASRIMSSDVQAYIDAQKAEFTRNLIHGKRPQDAALRINRLTLRKGDFRLHDISFRLPIGKTMTLLGGSGSGKTLLLKAIAGLEAIDSGSVSIGNWEIDGLPPHERKLGFVFEDYALFEKMTASENIAFPLKVSGRRRSIIAQETQKRISEISLDPAHLSLLPKQLPHGVQQLVAFARARNHDVELFLLDEPMSQLDDHHLGQMRTLIRKTIRDLGRTTLMTSHEPEDALAVSDYVGVLEGGRMLQYGETWSVYHHPESLAVMDMMSRLGLNRLAVEIRKGTVLPYGIPTVHGDGPYTMAFRAEEVETATEGIEAKIRSSQFLNGRYQLARCELGDGVTVDLALPHGVEDRCTFVPDHPCFFASE